MAAPLSQAQQPEPTPQPEGPARIPPNNGEGDGRPIVREDEEAAFEADLALLIEANPGIPEQQVRRSAALAEEAARLVAELGRDRVASFGLTAPLSGQAELRLVGAATAEERRLAATAGLLVRDGARFSLNEQDKRSEAVAAALWELGHRRFRTRTFEDGDIIEVTLPDLPQNEHVDVIVAGASSAARSQAGDRERNPTLPPGVNLPDQAAPNGNSQFERSDFLSQLLQPLRYWSKKPETSEAVSIWWSNGHLGEFARRAGP